MDSENKATSEEKSKVEEYVLPPKKRWGRRTLWFMILVGVPLLLVGLHWWAAEREEEALTSEIMVLDRLGEPMLACDFNKLTHPADGENAAPPLRGAGDAIDDDSKAWVDVEYLEIRSPLTRREAQKLARMIEENKPALAMLEAARGRKGVYWSEYFHTPMCDMGTKTLGMQRVLSKLVQAKVLLAHHQGNDREAIAGISDLLMMSRALEEMLPGFSHPAAAGYATTACERLIQIAPELRIGKIEATVDREDVMRLIRALEDESSLVEGQMRCLRWERASHAETVRAVQDERIRPAMWRSWPLPIQVMIYAAKPAAMGDARAILALSTLVINAGESADNWPGFETLAMAPLSKMEAVDRNSGWQGIARPKAPAYDQIMKQHYIHLAERRLAASALAMRLYAVEHEGQFPGTFAELTPGYLARVPADPLARKGTELRYVPDAKRPIVYSVGSNGRDDGGSDQMKSNYMEYRLALGEDAVAHLRMQPRKYSEREQDETSNLFSGRYGGYAGPAGAGRAEEGD